MINLINTNTVDIDRVNNDLYGNPRYVMHFTNIDSDYSTALYIAKTAIGGKKYHNKSYGGGIVWQSYNIGSDINALNSEIINYNLGKYAGLLWDSFELDQGYYDLISQDNSKIKQLRQYIDLECKSMIYENFFRGLPSCFNFPFSNYDIEQWGKRNKLLRNNASDSTICEFCDQYWHNLAIALSDILNNVK